jgi:hypothetical protein
MKSEVFFSGIESKIIEELNNSYNSVDIAVAWITNTNILKCLRNCLSKGVEIRIITVKDHINRIEAYEQLYYNGASIRMMSSKMMHNKFCIIDNRKVISGSFNWTANANNNHENITVSSGDYEFVKQYSNEFDKLFNKSKCIGNLVPIELEVIEDLEDGFNYFKSEVLRQVSSRPYIYFISKDHFKIKSSNQNGEIVSGYYYIESQKEEEYFLKYIFYARCNQKFSKLRQIVEIPNKITALKINKILDIKAYDEGVVKIHKKSFVEINQPYTLAEISNNSEISPIKHSIISNYKNSYITKFENEINFIDCYTKKHLKYNNDISCKFENAVLISDSIIYAKVSVQKSFKFNIIVDKYGKLLSDLYFDNYKKIDTTNLIELRIEPILIFDKKYLYKTDHHSVRYQKEYFTQNWILNIDTNYLYRASKIKSETSEKDYSALYLDDSVYRVLYFVISTLIDSNDEITKFNLRSLKNDFDIKNKNNKLSVEQQIAISKELFLKVRLENYELKQKKEQWRIDKVKEDRVKEQNETITIITIIFFIIITIYILTQ